MTALARKPRASREETRERIVVKANELFHKYGFDRTTIADIASSLGMSSANVYKFFPSRRALIEATANLCLGELRDIIRQAARTRTNALGRIEAVVLSLYHFNRKQVKNDYEFYRLMLQIHQEEWSCVRDFCELQLKALTDILDDGVKSGEFKITDTLQAARIISDSIEWVVNPVLFYQLKGEDVEAKLHAQIQFLAKALK